MDLLPFPIPRRPNQSLRGGWQARLLREAHCHGYVPNSFKAPSSSLPPTPTHPPTFLSQPTGLAETIEAINTCQEAGVKLIPPTHPPTHLPLQQAWR